MTWDSKRDSCSYCCFALSMAIKKYIEHHSFAAPSLLSVLKRECMCMYACVELFLCGELSVLQWCRLCLQCKTDCAVPNTIHGVHQHVSSTCVLMCTRAGEGGRRSSDEDDWKECSHKPQGFYDFSQMIVLSLWCSWQEHFTVKAVSFRAAYRRDWMLYCTFRNMLLV